MAAGAVLYQIRISSEKRSEEPDQLAVIRFDAPEILERDPSELPDDAAVHGIIGTPPTSVTLTDDLMGSQFDVLVYNNAYIDKWKVSGLDIKVSDANGVSFTVGDQFYAAVSAYAKGVVAGSENDPEKYSIKTGDQLFVENYTSTFPTDQFLDEAPADWDTNYANYNRYDTTTKRIVPVEDSTFSSDANVLSSSMSQAWTNSKSNYSDTVDTSACKTIVTVDSVNSDTGNITGITIFKVGEYDNTDTSILDILTKVKTENTSIKGVYITTDQSDPKLAIQPDFTLTNFKVTEENNTPVEIKRYTVTGSLGSLFRVQYDPTTIPANYYSSSYGINPTTEVGGIRMSGGSTGFFDDTEMSEIEFKWRYSALLVKAFRGRIDPSIQSPTRCPAKFMFDAGYNTIVGSTILPYLQYTPADIINASIIFTDDEKEEILFNPEIISGLKYEDIDVKQAMYDLLIYRVYQGIPEDKRPIGPGSGMSLHLDSGITDGNTAMLVNTSFAKRFDNPNASWDIGGWEDVETGCKFTATKQIVDNLIRHSREYSINKPYTGSYTAITPDRYISYFPDVDTTDWELRELLYNSGGNAWIMGPDGSLTRRSQRTLMRDADTSDLLQESNMRTLSQLTYLLQNKIDSFLLEYNDDDVIKTLSDEVNNMFSNWVGNLVDALDITFTRDINIDGGEILVCYCNVTFRGLILRVPIIVNVNRRQYNS